MGTTQQLSITLPIEMANEVRAKVQSGFYASESEVMRDGLRALMERDKAMESWLNQQVAPAYDDMETNPSRGIGIDKVRARLHSKHSSKQ